MKELFEMMFGWMSNGQLNAAWMGTLLISILAPSPISTISFVICLIICVYTCMR